MNCQGYNYNYSITGGATVILAMGQAVIASKAMQEYLTTGVWQDYCPS